MFSTLPVRVSLALLVFTAASCGSPSAAPPPEPNPGCNPVVGDDCLTPYPSFFHETADTTTTTGVRVHIADGALPVQANAVPISPMRLNQKDGFSPATPFLVYFKDGVDPSQLIGLDAIATSVMATSPYQVIELDSGARVPVMAEIDANAAAGDRQALIIRPMTRLKPATRYIIAMVGVKNAAGLPLDPAPFKALRDRAALSKALVPWKAHYEEIFAALTKAQIPRSSLSLAWDVVTASDATATGHLLKMRDEALAMATPTGLGYTLPSPTDTPSDPNLYREILGTVQVPSYLADESGKSEMNFGTDGQPAMRAVVDVPIVIHIPTCAFAAPSPRPVLVFGHGLFSTAKEEMDSPVLEALANQFCFTIIGTNWLGLSSDDVPNIEKVISKDLNGMYLITDRLQQGQVNAAVMTRTFLTKIVDDPLLSSGGMHLVDPAQVYYFGISLGGIEGGTFMGLNEDITRGVLNVPGCEWSLLIFRSGDFNSLHPLLGLALPDPLDQQVAIAATQSEWDYADPATYAPHILLDPLPGSPKKHILVQESEGDAQVTNVATRVLARTMGLPGMDLEHQIYGITEMPAPLDSAYTQWDSQPMPLPPSGDEALPMDNGAHNAVYPNPLAQAQIHAFLTPTGQVTQTCTGACIFHQ